MNRNGKAQQTDQARHNGDSLPENDLASILKRLMSPESSTRKTKEARQRLANHPLTREYLDAGLRLIAEQFKPIGEELDGEGWQSPSLFFSWLSEQKVINEVARAGKQRGSPATFNDRWPYRDFYIEDLISYSLWERHWSENVNIARRTQTMLTERREPASVSAIAHEAAYRIASLKLSDYFRLFMITGTISDRYPELKAMSSNVYRSVDEEWAEVYKTLFCTLGLKLRPDVTFQDIADIFSAVSGGLTIHALLDQQRKFIDDETRKSLLGKASIALLMAFADTDSGGHTVEEAFDLMAGPVTS